MSGQLLPPPEFDHPLPASLSVADRVQVYVDLLEASEQMLLSGLRATLPPGADVYAALQQVYDRQSEEHYQSLVRVAERFNQLEMERGAGRSEEPADGSSAAPGQSSSAVDCTPVRSPIA